MNKLQAIPDNVLLMLENLTVENNVAKKYPYPLLREEYVALNKVLSALGSKWVGKKIQGHVFPHTIDAKQAIDECLSIGTYERPDTYGFFRTPKLLAQKLVNQADVQPNHRVLEPSAGDGAITDEIIKIGAAVACVELQHKNVEILKKKGYKNIRECDLLTMHEQDWDVEWPIPFFHRIVMNPPFANQQDIDHVLYCFDLLRSKGILVSVMSAGVKFRENKKTVAFREFVKKHEGTIENLPENSFKESGTNVRTVMVSLRKK